MHDPELLERMRTGDVEARNAIVESHLPVVIATIQKHYPKHLTCDLVQDAVLALLTKLPRYDERRASIRTFISFIAYRAAQDALRSFVPEETVRIPRHARAAARAGAKLMGRVALDDPRGDEGGTIAAALVDPPDPIPATPSTCTTRSSTFSPHSTRCRGA